MIRLTEKDIWQIKLDLERRQDAGNVHRILRARYRIDNAWRRYQNKNDDISYADLLKDIEEAKSQVW